MSVMTSGCEGTHTDGRVGDGLVGPPGGDTPPGLIWGTPRSRRDGS